MNKTKIEWATHSWNPVVGCSEISEGCRHCYAKAIAKRFGRYAWGTPTLFEKRLEEPFGLRDPGRIFVCSMSDLFHEDLSDADINRVFEIMVADNRHTYMVLTKRPGRMALFLHGRTWTMGGYTVNGKTHEFIHRWPLPNVWLGVTAETQARLDDRLPILMQIPAAVHFVSIEPMLEPIMLPTLDDHVPEWAIVGPETGAGRRPCAPEWIESVSMQCADLNIPFFDKRTPFIRREYPNGELAES